MHASSQITCHLMCSLQSHRFQLSLKAGLQNLRERVVTLVQSYQAWFESSREPWNMGRPWTLPFPLLRHAQSLLSLPVSSGIPFLVSKLGNCWHDVGIV